MGCGAGLAQAPPPSGMRFVTVAFCDISGSTQLALRFDPQVWHSILEAYFAEVGGALVASGGRLEKFIGDAVVGVFGADAAGEEDALRAVRGALDALDRLAARNDETIGRYGIRLSIRFGIASGRVVMADRDSSFAIGSVMNRAARLQAAAPADGAVVDVRTWLLVRDHLGCEPVPPVPAKGFDKPLQAWAVSREPVTALAGPVFVNQSELITQLGDAVGEAAQTPGVHTISLEGEMGSGKTRVLRKLAESAKSRQMHTLFITCRRNDAEQGLWRLQQIERALGTPWRSAAVPGNPAEERVSALALGHASRAAAPSTSEVQWRVRKQLAELSRERPLVILVDDYEYSPEALRGLRELPADLPGPVVFVLAGADCAGRAAAIRFRVPSLSDGHAYELLAALHGDVELHEAATLEPLVRRSRGNPLFLEQLAAMAADGIDDEVAPSAEAALGARIDRLPPPARQVLACIGAWGGDLRPGDLDAVCDLDETTLTASLGELESLGLAGNQTAGEVAYAHLVLGERARVHTAIARRLQEYAATDPALLELAVVHAGKARQYWRELDPGSERDADATRLAAQCLAAAARRAIGRSEVRAASAFAGQARALGVPEEALALEIAALESYALGAGGQVAEALECIAATAGLRGNPSARVHLKVTEMALAGVAPNGIRELAQAAGDPCATARLDTWEGLQAAREGDYPRAEALLRKAHAAMSDFGPGLGVAEIYGNLSLFLSYGDTPVAEAAAQCLALREEVADAPILHAVVSCSAAVLLQRKGDRIAAAQMLDAAREVFTEMGHVIGQAGSHEFASAIAELDGDVGAACANTLTAMRVYRDAGATVAATRCAMRAFVLDPTRPVPDTAGLGGANSWDLRVLRHQVAALTTDRRESHLAAAMAEIDAIRGEGAKLIPRLGCERIASAQ